MIGSVVPIAAKRIISALRRDTKSSNYLGVAI